MPPLIVRLPGDQPPAIDFRHPEAAPIVRPPADPWRDEKPSWEPGSDEIARF